MQQMRQSIFEIIQSHPPHQAGPNQRRVYIFSLALSMFCQIDAIHGEERPPNYKDLHQCQS